MKNIVSLLVVILFAVGGSVAGTMLRGSGDGQGAAHASVEGSSEHKSKTDKSHGSSSGDHGSGHGAASDHGGDSSDTSFYKFSREFVVPIMAERRVKALVILHISLEVDKKGSDELFSLDPKLRDNIMTTLIALSNDGQTLEELTSPDSYETIRSMILMNLNSGISEDIKNVLIMDVGKQDL